jgi:hypothetical protein
MLAGTQYWDKVGWVHIPTCLINFAGFILFMPGTREGAGYWTHCAYSHSGFIYSGPTYSVPIRARLA